MVFRIETGKGESLPPGQNGTPEVQKGSPSPETFRLQKGANILGILSGDIRVLLGPEITFSSYPTDQANRLQEKKVGVHRMSSITGERRRLRGAYFPTLLSLRKMSGLALGRKPASNWQENGPRKTEETGLKREQN